MKTLKFFFLALFLCICGYMSAEEKYAKFPDIDTLDISNMECIYTYSVTDPELSKTQEEYRILQIGNKYSKYSEYNNYRCDSILAWLDRTKITYKAADEIFHKYSPRSSDYVLNDKSNGILHFYGKVFIDNYTYTDSVPDLKWTLVDETKTVCGQVCHKAEADFRGRHWTAWYCDIPISEGPWKFGGLPGLILEVEDSAKEISISAITIRPAKNPMLQDRLRISKITRKRFNKALLDYKSDPGKMFNASQLAPKNMDGTKVELPKRKMFYNPMEKD